MKSLQDAVSKEQMKTLETTGHTLKGMLASMSAIRAALAASRLQEIGRGGKHSQLKEALAALEFGNCGPDTIPELDACLVDAGL